MILSYLITVCNELEEFEKCYLSILNFKRDKDEIVVIFDSNKGSEQVKDHLDGRNIPYSPYRFEGNFSDLKNFGGSQCSGDWIFQLDADEYLPEAFVEFLPSLLQSREVTKEVSIINIPRVNIVRNISTDHIDSWRWQVGSLEDYVEECGIESIDPKYFDLIKNKDLILDFGDEIIKFYTPIINYPDYQSRLYRNSRDVKWEGKVHERVQCVSPFYKSLFLPQGLGYDIIHIKEIKKQETQNKYYDSLI